MYSNKNLIIRITIVNNGHYKKKSITVMIIMLQK